MLDNILLSTDSYKASHAKQYPEGTEYVYSYLESRGGKFDNTVFTGLQALIQEHLTGRVVTASKIDEADEIITAHMGAGNFNREGWEYILNEHNGVLPIQIKAVPEGTVVNTSNVLMTVVNTDPKCWWLTNYLESLLLHVWYPTTVATLSRECKKLIAASLRETADHKNKAELDASLDFKLHDFGFRGVSSLESASIGAAAHLLSFKGTDTLAAIPHISKYYGTSEMPGFSIPASEHSTITSWGQENEIKAFENMLDLYPTGHVACVSDSYDISQATDVLWPALKDKIMARDGVLIVRPDSGDIKMTLQVVLNNLWKHFGGHTTAEGYKVLHPSIRVIQGDGMNYESLKDLLQYLPRIGFSTENLAFGMGGALLQKVDRDTQKFAFKCSSININGEWEGVQKAPTEIDENGDKHASFKKSKRGRLALSKSRVAGQFATISLVGNSTYSDDQLKLVFEDGVQYRKISFQEARKNAAL